MRTTWMATMVLAAAGCAGGIGSTPWDKNGDGLVGACEGLNRQACAATAGCEGQELACIAICRPDGLGGCLPCPEDFRCVPVAQPACQSLNPSQCAADPRCEVSPAVACPAICELDATGGCKPCNVGSSCQPRPPPPPVSCSQIPSVFCALAPQCELQTQTYCTGVAHAGEDDPAAPGCGGGGGCVTVQICANRPSQICENTPVDSCTSNPACELEQGPVCEIACLQGSECPPCATPTPRCVTRPPSDACGSLSDDQCTASAGCRLDGAVCSLVCEDDGKGGCLPCPGSPTRCVPLDPTPVPPPAPGTK